LWLEDSPGKVRETLSEKKKKKKKSKQNKTKNNRAVGMAYVAEFNSQHHKIYITMKIVKYRGRHIKSYSDPKNELIFMNF
jgi:hypothetical protein